VPPCAAAVPGAGVDQAGLPEVLATCLRRLPKHISAAVAAGGVILTGGNVLFPGQFTEGGGVQDQGHQGGGSAGLMR
jgi:actin-related protein